MRTPAPFARPALAASVITAAIAIALLPRPAPAGVNFDFEQRYFMEPGMIAADHAILATEGEYHLIYTVGFQGQGWIYPDNMVDFGHASSPDLVHWTVLPHVLTTEAPGWKERNLWAPHIMTSFHGDNLLFFTGVDSAIVQQIGIAYSPDLFDWIELPLNPVYRPDTTWADWQPAQWSNCRDPFVMKVAATQQFAMLTTASTRPGYQGIPDARGAISLAFSDDWTTWTDNGAPLFINDSYRVLESTYMAQHSGLYYLFYNEQGIPGVHYMTSTQPFAGWDKSTAQLLEYEGFAAETFQRSTRWLFARVRDGIWNGVSILGIKIDDLIWQGTTPTIGPQNAMLDNWTIVSGDAFDLQPTFGDRPGDRSGEPSNLEGFFMIATAEQHAGPLAWGCPECPPDDGLTGVLRSRVFRISDDYLALRVGGGNDPDALYVSLRRANGSEIDRATGLDSDVMREVVWDLRPYQGLDVYLEIADQRPAGPFGHLNVDWIRETDAPPAGVAALAGAAPSTLRVDALASPGRAPLRFRITLDRESPLVLAIYDVLGRRLRTLDLGRQVPGVHGAIWDGRDEAGTPAAAGVYFYRLDAPHAEARGRLVLAP